MGDSKAIHRKSESLRKWNGTAETFTGWTQHVMDHLAKVHPEWKRLLTWMSTTEDSLEFAQLTRQVIGPFNESAKDLAEKLEQLLADYLPEKQYLRRTQLSGGQTESGNGFTMWRRLHRDNKGEGQIVDYAGTQCLREYGRCDNLQQVSAHIDGWYDLFDSYGKELEHAHMMTRGMFLDIIPKELRTEILKEPKLHNAGHRALAEWCRNRVLVLTSERLADLRKKELTQRSKIGSLLAQEEESDSVKQLKAKESEMTKTLAAMQQLIAMNVAAMQPPPKATSAARRSGSPRRSPSPGRKNLIDWPQGKCFHCGGDHNRDACDKFKKMMQDANPGKPRSEWKPPAGYKSALAKARDLAKAKASAKPKARPTKKINALMQDEVEPELVDDTASEFSSDGEPFGGVYALRPLSTAVSRLAPQPISTINRFSGLEEGQSYDADMLQSLNLWAHNVRVKPSIIRKAKATADPEIERLAKFVSNRAKPRERVIVMNSIHDVDKASHAVKPLPTNRHAMTKLVKKLASNVSCQPNERLVMVDSGAFTHAIDASVELPEFEVIPLGSDETGLDGESACGGIMKCLGRVQTCATVEGVPLNVTWQSMKVKVPILSVRKLVRDKHNVRFHDGGGYITCIQTGMKIPFFEYQGVYYLKMRFSPPHEKSRESVFIRPEP
jgi:hypothetical protein